MREVVGLRGVSVLASEALTAFEPKESTLCSSRLNFFVSFLCMAFFSASFFHPYNGGTYRTSKDANVCVCVCAGYGTGMGSQINTWNAMGRGKGRGPEVLRTWEPIRRLGGWVGFPGFSSSPSFPSYCGLLRANRAYDLTSVPICEDALIPTHSYARTHTQLGKLCGWHSWKGASRLLSTLDKSRSPQTIAWIIQSPCLATNLFNLSRRYD